VFLFFSILPVSVLGAFHCADLFSSPFVCVGGYASKHPPHFSFSGRAAGVGGGRVALVHGGWPGPAAGRWYVVVYVCGFSKCEILGFPPLLARGGVCLLFMIV